MADEPTAIRHPHRGKAHRELARWGVTVCRDTTKGYEFFKTLTEWVPLSQVAPEDRCRTCWKDTP